MVIIDEKNQASELVQALSHPIRSSTILNKYGPELVEKIIKSSDSEIRISSKIVDFVIEYLSVKLRDIRFKAKYSQIKESDKRKLFSLQDVFCAGILLSIVGEDYNLGKILKSQESSLFDNNGLKFLLRFLSKSSNYNLLANHLENISVDPYVRYKMYSELKSTIYLISGSQPIPEHVNKYKKEFIRFLLTLPVDFVDFNDPLLEQAIHVVTYLACSAENSEILDIVEVMLDFLEVDSMLILSSQYCLLKAIAECSKESLKEDFSRLLEQRLQINNNFTSKVLARIYDLNLGLRDINWINSQIANVVPNHTGSLPGLSSIASDESINMVAGNRDYAGAIRMIATTNIKDVSAEKMSDMHASIMLVRNISTELEQVYGAGCHLKEKDDLASYLYNLMSNCHDTKLKFFGIARLDKKESADEGLYLVGSIQVSLIRLPNGNCAVHEPNLKRGYMILNKNSLSKIVDYICDKLSKQISQKFPEKKLSSVSVAPYTVKKRISLDFAYSGSEVLFGGTARIRSKTPTGTPKRRDSNDNAESAAIGLERSRSAPHF